MKFSIFKYLKYGRYRPLNIVESFLIKLLNFFLIKKSKNYSFHILWYKNPPPAIRYYNHLGRFVILVFNFFSIVIFNKIFIKSMGTSEEVYKSISKGSNFYRWPETKKINYKKEKISNLEEILNKIKLQYEYSKKKKLKYDLDFWAKNRGLFEKNFFDKDGNVILDNLENFRNLNHGYSSHLLSSHNIENIDSRINKLKALRIFIIYHKVAELVDDDIIINISDTNIGNSKFIHYRKQLINERILRQAYFLSQLRNNINLNKNDYNIFCDIGSGYGLLPSLLKKEFNFSKFILVDLPELNVLSYYYLKNLFPNSKICLSHEIQNQKIIDRDFISQFDFLILDQDDVQKLDNKLVDCVINTASLGEMSKMDQNFYINQIQRISNKYFYSVNRHRSDNVIFSSTNSYYDFNLDNKSWTIKLYKFSPTFHIEVLLEKS